MSVDDPPQLADDFIAPAESAGLIDLELHWREGRNPGDLPVAHLGKLLLGDEEAMFDRGDAPFDRMLDAIGPRSVSECLPAALSGGIYDGADFIDWHLRRRSHATRFEIDDPAHQELDAIGPGGNAARDTV